MVLDPARRQDLQPLEQGVGFLASVGLHVARDHVDALGVALAGGFEHRVRLADPGGGAEEDLEPAAMLVALLRLQTAQKRIGIGTLVGHELPVISHRGRRRPPLANRHCRRSCPTSHPA